MTNLADADPRPQLEEKPAKFVPGQPDMWMFVLFETLLFTGYFSVYLVSRTQNRELYLQSQADLDLRVGRDPAPRAPQLTGPIEDIGEASEQLPHVDERAVGFVPTSFGLTS